LSENEKKTLDMQTRSQKNIKDVES